jgi:hypothetical protein
MRIAVSGGDFGTGQRTPFADLQAADGNRAARLPLRHALSRTFIRGSRLDDVQKRWRWLVVTVS